MIIVEESVAVERKDALDFNGEKSIKSDGSNDFMDRSNGNNQRKLLQDNGDMEDREKVVDNSTPSVAFITDSSSCFMAENMPLVAGANSEEPEIGASNVRKSFGGPVECFKSSMMKDLRDDEKSTCLGTVLPE